MTAIHIQMPYGADTIEVLETVGSLAIHEMRIDRDTIRGDLFSVTHVPSGYLVAQCDSFDNARIAARVLNHLNFDQVARMDEPERRLYYHLVAREVYERLLEEEIIVSSGERKEG